MAGNPVFVFACAAAATGLGPLPFFLGKGQPAAIGVGQRRSLKRSQPGAQFTRCNMADRTTSSMSRHAVPEPPDRNAATLFEPRYFPCHALRGNGEGTIALHG